jgi:dTDP-4-dehydrorhamnose 3,5-epimerase
MRFLPTAIPDVILVEPKVFTDDRGFFLETFQARKYAEGGITAVMIQDNHAGSRGGVLRGLHYQIRHPQGKLVSVVVGQVFDVAVDLRRSSPTFTKWVGTYLSAQDRRQLWVPPGFAHGYYVLSSWAEVTYKTTDYYSPEWERTVAWDDPQIGVQWPLPDGQKPVISAKDAQGKRLADAELFD